MKTGHSYVECSEHLVYGHIWLMGEPGARIMKIYVLQNQQEEVASPI